MRFLWLLVRGKYALVGYRLLLGAIFIYASIHKIGEPYEFARIVHNYRILPPELVNIVAITLPWIEIVTGLLLVLGLFTRENALIVFGMLCVFIFGMAAALWRGLEIDCGCFRPGADSTNLWARILEDLVMLTMAGLVLAYGAGCCAVERLWQRKRAIGSPAGDPELSFSPPPQGTSLRCDD